MMNCIRMKKNNMDMFKYNNSARNLTYQFECKIFGNVNNMFVNPVLCDYLMINN